MRRRQTGRVARDIQGIGTGCRASVLCLALLWGCTGTVIDADPTATSDEQQSPRAIKMHYKIGTPYAINGLWYYPKVDYAYDESGIASWYGKKFDARPTANGEFFSIRTGWTAAHRTLPLPSIVRVTNLENGRVLVVRVNESWALRARTAHRSVAAVGPATRLREPGPGPGKSTDPAGGNAHRGRQHATKRCRTDRRDGPRLGPRHRWRFRFGPLQWNHWPRIPGSRLAPPRKRPGRPANRIAPDLPNVTGFRETRSHDASFRGLDHTDTGQTDTTVRAGGDICQFAKRRQPGSEAVGYRAGPGSIGTSRSAGTLSSSVRTARRCQGGGPDSQEGTRAWISGRPYRGRVTWSMVHTGTTVRRHADRTPARSHRRFVTGSGTWARQLSSRRWQSFT